MGSETEMLKKFRANFDSFEEIWLFIQIFFLVTLSPTMLRLFSIPGLILKVHQNREKLKGKIVKFTDYILGRNFLMYKITCLKRSLVLYHFLRKSGIDVRICFGVKYNKLSDKEAKEKLDGHAWLLYEGDIYLERNVELTKTYTITYRFPAKHFC